MVVTVDGVWRGEKLLLLKNLCDEAMQKCSEKGFNVKHCVVVSHLKRVTAPISIQENFGKVLYFSFVYFLTNWLYCSSQR